MTLFHILTLWSIIRCMIMAEIQNEYNVVPFIKRCLFIKYR